MKPRKERTKTWILSVLLKVCLYEAPSYDPFCLAKMQEAFWRLSPYYGRDLSALEDFLCCVILGAGTREIPSGNPCLGWVTEKCNEQAAFLSARKQAFRRECILARISSQAR